MSLAPKVAALVLAGSLWAKESSFLLLRGVDVYGTRQITIEQIQERFGQAINDYVRVRSLRSSSRGKLAGQLDAKAQDLKESVESGVARMGDFALVRLDWTEKALSTGTEQGRHDIYITLEIVETKDKNARLPVHIVPKKHLQDASGLIQAWTEYTDLGWQLVRKGELLIDRVPCPAFYCSWGSVTSDLKNYEDRFVQQVPIYEDFLVDMLREDADATHRANALYLLSYLKNGVEVSNLAGQGLTDPDGRVREAAIRIYNDMVLHYPDVPIPVSDIVAVLDYPQIEDRARALGLVLSMADKPAYRSFLIEQAVPVVLRILRLQEPSNHQLAYAVLGLLSGQNFGDRDYQAWETWAFKARAALHPEKGEKARKGAKEN